MLFRSNTQDFNLNTKVVEAKYANYEEGMADSKAKNGRNYSLAPTFLLQAGQILESQGKKEEAAKIYKDIKANYVNAMVVQSQEIDKYIERATLK